MGLGGFAGEGQEARVWRLANDVHVEPRALRLAGPERHSFPKRSGSPLTTSLPDCPHLLAIGSSVDAGPTAVAAVLPLLSGGSLATRLTEIGPLPAIDCGKVAASMRDALAALHAAGLVHLDVSPANILLTSAGLPVLADTAGVVLADGQIAQRGTPPYTVPGVDASPSTDWIALGRVLTELASGSPRTQISHLPETLQPAVRDLLAGRDPDQTLGAVSAGSASADSDDAPQDRRLAVYPVGRIVPSHQRATMDFIAGSRASEPDPNVSKRWGNKRRVVLSMVGAASLIAAFCGVALASGSDPESNCPGRPGADQIEPGFVAVAADTGGPCPTRVLWSQRSGTLVVPTSAGPQRFALGQPGDVLSFGDWDCNGTVTPALRRDGQMLVFSRWPQDAPVRAVEQSSEPPAC